MATKAQMNYFLSLMIPIAQRQAKKHDMKIFPSVCIAQACHESGWGTSKKMMEANAVFGIKVGGSAAKFGTAWKGAAYKTGTTEYYDGKNPTKIVDYFRKYDSLEDATEDYMDMLCKASRYKKALNQKTPQKCIEGIVSGGYATGPNYVNAIMKIIDIYGLTEYDNVNQTSQTSQTSDCPYPYPAITLKLTMQGIEVKWLQWQLNRHGSDLVVDGIFGNKTLESVKNFQSGHKDANGNPLVVDGIVGKLTKAELKR